MQCQEGAAEDAENRPWWEARTGGGSGGRGRLLPGDMGARLLALAEALAETCTDFPALALENSWPSEVLQSWDVFGMDFLNCGFAGRIFYSFRALEEPQDEFSSGLLRQKPFPTAFRETRGVRERRSD